jgi:demethylmenaquinone methyltransferase/2-methoxy-6-polyprenyl-1,4-benzoquinol methylase
MVLTLEDDKARFVRAMFTRIALRYDLMNSLMTFGRHHSWRRTAALMAAPRPGGLALDVATGTGDLAAALVRAARVRRVLATDFSEGMLAVGQRKLRGAGLGDRVRFLVSDALSLPFPDRTFDGVASAFLLRNLVDLRQGLAEMQRVVKPGGTVVALEITQPTLPGFKQLFRWYFHTLVPWVGGIVSGDREAYAYLPRSVDRFVTPGELGRLMEAVGLGQVFYRRLGLGTVTIHVGTA